MRSKKYQSIKSKVDASKIYTLDEAIDFIKANRASKFDETIEVHIQLGIDPQKTEQQVRGSVNMPYSGVKKRRIAAFVTPAKIEEAKEAGADLVGGQDLIEKIKTTNKCDFDVAVAEPALMKDLASIAKILGPKGLMPSPKSETVAADVKKTISELKKGKTTFKSDAGGNCHQGLGKVSWEKEKIKENFDVLLTAVKKVKPQKVKGLFIKKVVLASTMGPGIKIKI